MQFTDIHALAQRLHENVRKVIIGKDEQIDLVLTSILAGGHILLEDVPGTGKTMLARAVAKSLDCDFSRVQFTPDLLPGDVTGMSIYHQGKEEFVFTPGPVFTNILLADEINRATPRTQSALLECMEEKQVTENGVTRMLEKPFLVLATQNPVETQGTFPLPEAQTDRFLMKLEMGYPENDEAVAMMERFLSDNPIETLEPVAKKEEIIEGSELIKTCHVSRPVMEYIAALCEKTRDKDTVQLGVSPRGMLALLHACQAYAAIRGRDFVTPDDVKFLAVPVLAHRIMMRGLYGKKNASAEFVQQTLEKLTAPTEENK